MSSRKADVYVHIEDSAFPLWLTVPIGEPIPHEKLLINMTPMKKLPLVALLVAAMSGLAFSAALAQQPAASNGSKGLSSLFTKSSEDELLEPNLAFKLNVSAKGPNTVIAEIVPAKGYYVYKERIRVAAGKDSGVTVAGLKFPKGEMKTDQIFGRTEVFKAAVPVEVTLKRDATAKTVALTVSYQGCHEKLGVCYPPIDKTVNVALP